MASNEAFVIMQIGQAESPERRRADEIYNYIIQPTLRPFGLTAYRADLDASPGSITPRMLAKLVEAPLVIADLTGRNPNVFYELGIVHAFARPLICLAEGVDHLPFYAKDERVITLGKYGEAGLTMSQGEEAKNAIQECLAIVTAEGYEPPTPLREVAANRSLGDLAPTDPVAAELEQMREILDEVRGNVTPRLAVPAHVKIELSNLRQVLEYQSKSLDDEDMAILTNGDVSNGHKAWVQSLVARRNTPVDDPWATGPSGSGFSSGASAGGFSGTQDDPPF